MLPKQSNKKKGFKVDEKMQFILVFVCQGMFISVKLMV